MSSDRQHIERLSSFKAHYRFLLTQQTITNILQQTKKKKISISFNHINQLHKKINFFKLNNMIQMMVIYNNYSIFEFTFHLHITC